MTSVKKSIQQRRAGNPLGELEERERSESHPQHLNLPVPCTQAKRLLPSWNTRCCQERSPHPVLIHPHEIQYSHQQRKKRTFQGLSFWKGQSVLKLQHSNPQRPQWKQEEEAVAARGVTPERSQCPNSRHFRVPTLAVQEKPHRANPQPVHPPWGTSTNMETATGRRAATPSRGLPGTRGVCPGHGVLLSITAGLMGGSSRTWERMGRTSSWALKGYLLSSRNKRDSKEEDSEMPAAGAGKKPRSLTTCKPRRNQYKTIQLHRTLLVSNSLRFINLRSISQLLSWASGVFLLTRPESWIQNYFSLLLFIHLGTIYNSNAIFYCVPEWILLVRSE